MDSPWFSRSWGKSLEIYLIWNLCHCSLRNKVYVLVGGLHENISSTNSMAWWVDTSCSSIISNMISSSLVCFSNAILSFSLSSFNYFLSSECCILRILNFSYKCNHHCSNYAWESSIAMVSLYCSYAIIFFHVKASNPTSSCRDMRSSMLGSFFSNWVPSWYFPR